VQRWRSLLLQRTKSCVRGLRSSSLTGRTLERSGASKNRNCCEYCPLHRVVVSNITSHKRSQEGTMNLSESLEKTEVRTIDYVPENVPNQHFVVGDWVEVRSKDEILRTLDKNGQLDGLPFMPEMFKFCGRQLRVYKRAHKTCDTVHEYKGR